MPSDYSICNFRLLLPNTQVLRLLSKIRMKARRSTTTAALNQMFEAHHDQMQDFVTWRERRLRAVVHMFNVYLPPFGFC